MLWPERSDNWRLGAKPAQTVFAAVAAAIAGSETVTVGVSAAQFHNARARLPRTVRVVEITSNDAWMRDCGPTFVIDGKGGAAASIGPSMPGEVCKEDCIFHGTGMIRLRRRFWRSEGADRYRTPLVMEGGAIHVDGQGTCLTTEECLLNPNRNPHLTRADVEEQLRGYLGVSKIIWLGKGVYLDETGGHIDELACFTSPGHVGLTWTEDRTDPQYEISQDAYQRLRHATDARGRRSRFTRSISPGRCT